MNICLIGCGKMGSSLIEGWLSLKEIKHISVIEPDLAKIQKKNLNKKNFNFYQKLEDVDRSIFFDVTILAVKPQIMEAVLNQLLILSFRSNAWLSVAAGLKVKFYERILGNNEQIIRTIPNTPASVRKGVTAIHFNNNCGKSIMNASILVMQAVGEVVIVDNEDMMDAYTAVSGSGPAYYFYFVEAIINAARELGIDQQNAKILAEKTFVGSAHLLEKSDEEVQDLRKAVTSPRGTTEAGLGILMKKDVFFNLTNQAIKKAQKRGKELGKS